MNHSPTPWNADELDIFDGNAEKVTTTFWGDYDDDVNAANAVHIARCVNFCGETNADMLDAFTLADVIKRIDAMNEQLLALHTNILIKARLDESYSERTDRMFWLQEESEKWLREHGHDPGAIYHNWEDHQACRDCGNANRHCVCDLADPIEEEVSDRDGAEAQFESWLTDGDESDHGLVLKYVSQDELDLANREILALDEDRRQLAAESYLDQWHEIYQDVIADDPDADLGGMEDYHDGTDGDCDEDDAPALTLRPDSNKHYALNPDSTNVWIIVDTLAVNIVRADEGVSVDIFPTDQKTDDSLAGTWAMWDEGKKDVPEEVELTRYYATERLIDSVWTLCYEVTDADNRIIKIISFDRENPIGYTQEKTLPTCRLHELNNRTVYQATIAEILYVVENPAHVFSYS